MTANYQAYVAQKAAQAALDARTAATEAANALTAQQQAYVAPAPVVAPSGSCATWIAEAGITDVADAMIVINRESGCRVNAANPSGAYGIPQALPGSKMASAGADWQTNPVTQLIWMQGYVISRYGSWAGAVAQENNYGWY